MPARRSGAHLDRDMQMLLRRESALLGTSYVEDDFAMHVPL